MSFATIATGLLLSACAGVQHPDAPAPYVAPDIVALRPIPGRLPRLADPTRYELLLTVDPRQPEFSGTTTIHLNVKVPTRVLHFHALQMAISRVTVKTGGKELAGSLSQANDAGARPESNEHVATFPEVIPAGPATITFEHKGPFDQHLTGLYRAREGDDWYASTQFEVADAKKAFPCFDEPGWKVPFAITLKVPDTLVAVSNAAEASRKSEGGWTTLQFQDTQPIPTYLVALAVGPFEVVDGPMAGKTPVRGLAPRGRGGYLGEALKMHAELLPRLEEYFAQPYGFGKLDAAAVLEFSAGAMENPGLIVYREELLLLDPDTSSETSRRSVATVVAHELSHQWFGNLVTLAWWDDLWLNEAFAEWMAGKIVDGWRPEFENGIAQLDRRESMLSSDALSTAQPIRKPGQQSLTLGGQFYYATFKGAPLLGMIEQWIGPEKFRDGVRRYLAARAFQNATSEDLFAALEASAGTEKPVREVMSRFIDRAGAPLISATLDCSQPASPRVSLRQTRFTTLGSAAEKGFPEGKAWLVPACVAFPANGTVQQACALVEDQPVVLPLTGATSCPAWIHPNSGENGYYRWTVAPEGLQALATGVQMPASDDASRQSLRRSQAAFLDQTWAQVSAGVLQPADYLQVVESVAQHADRRQLREVVAALVRVANTWEARASSPQFAAFVRRVLEPTARELTWKRAEGDDTDTLLLRPALLSAVAYYGQAGWALDGAEAQARDYLGSAQAVAPEIAAAALPVSARAGRIGFEDALGLLDRAKTPGERLTAIATLGSLPPASIGKAMALLTTEKIRLQDYRSLLNPALSRVESRNEAFAALRASWAEISRKASGFGGGGSILAGIAGDFCDARGRDEAIAFLSSQPGKSERSLKLGTEAANRCIAIRESGDASLERFLGTVEVPAPAKAVGKVPAPRRR